ncbi:hypothetical protein [Thiomicrorhabdus sp.]|uniref:hypothetical protein n=1 Tax=Thiomicrorhabdus sp. TaxID=2039724 RepID=UPI0029C700FA|nr:hypothetical protein [Thiomicrorhabdus sp.]
MSHSLTLWIPNFNRVLQTLIEIGADDDKTSLPALQTLWARGDLLSAREEDFYSHACYLFHQANTFPVAPLEASLQIDDFDSRAFWVRVDPVQMIPDRDTLVLIPPQDLNIQEEESKALLATFNEHFGADGVTLEFGGPSQWYLRIAQPVDISSTSLPSAAYRNLHGLYPQGNAATYWRQLMNETQMLFFDHPVNQARRDQGLAEINSVWVWGEGLLEGDKIKQRPQAAISASSSYLQALALNCQAVWQPQAAKLSSCLSFNFNEASSIQHELAVIDIDDRHFNEDILVEFDRNWFQPALQALKEKKIHSLLIDLGGKNILHFKPPHLRRFWRRKTVVTRML